MKRSSYILSLFFLVMLGGCGSGQNSVNNNGLFGNWNVAMYPTGSTTPAYVFGMAMSQEGTNNYSGASITYNGSVAPPSNMCINANTIRATATTSGTSYTMTITDTTSNTVISVNGTLATNTTTVNGNYTNAESRTCTASQGTMTMLPQ
jgi:hypothetical protein